MKKRAKLFMNGRSQAVRLPKEFRMPGTEVSIERRGDEVVLRPVPAHSSGELPSIRTFGELMERIAQLGPVDESFARAVREARAADRRHPPRDVSW